MSIEKIVENQRLFYRSNKTLDVDFRIKQLEKLKRVVKENEDIILKALKKDLYKSDFEGYITEIGILYEEINLAMKKLKKWAKRERVKTSIMYFPAKSYIYKEPYGVVLIIGPFNYPFQLVVSPLIGAIAGGNCAVIKPSEHTVATSKALEKIINDNFDEKYIKVVDPLGGREVVTELLESNFDKIFFTGSVRVGKIVMEKAAKRLIPITLELGGKSPCIVDKDVNIKMSAKRIVWGKYLNAGQTCVAPDYLCVHKDIKDELLREMVKEIKLQFGEDNRKSLDYPRIIRVEEVDRLSRYIDEGDIYYGGEIVREEKYISPTILINIKEGSKILEEEIFGPILPVYEFNNLQDVLDKVNEGHKPLALYYFSERKDQIEKVLKESSSGGVTINDTILHVSSGFLPFGGVGNSGMGSYHGKYSFECFSHSKAVLKRGTFTEFSFRFAPYKDKIKLVRKVFK
ncbi:Aldehyde dehydrogenase [Clostridium vincentii]|uniref:Aldehyde dehydrogenase n=2 Tax=Clostridium vincentii TaxID=52704 RepID=A0A2T0BFM1_9CLOT|nr:Aldehyde dehydrogenase [Clostridium vincentii]